MARPRLFQDLCTHSKFMEAVGWVVMHIQNLTLILVGFTSCTTEERGKIKYKK